MALLLTAFFLQKGAATDSLMKVQRTVGIFDIFSVTQILREIKFEDSRSAKSAIFTHLRL